MVRSQILVRNMENDKQSIRKEILNRRMMLTFDQCQEKSQLICNRIIESDPYINADVVYAYMAFRNEVDLNPLIRHAVQSGKTIAIPKIQEGKMRFFCPQMDEYHLPITESGYFGIHEPVKDHLEAPEPDLIIFPGTAFDDACHRLGYGKGFYDSYMKRQFNHTVITMGAAYSVQIIERIPTEPHDFILDYIITEEDIYAKG